jgi:AcrR family transcriptional regulator
MSLSGTTRRSPGEGRDLVIKAARELFSRRGYDGTTLRDIAEHSGVNESVIYRSIGTKDQIFRQSVIEPYNGFLESFMASWTAATQQRSNREMVGTFVRELYDLLSEHRELITALVAASTITGAEGSGVGRPQLNAHLDALGRQAELEAEARGVTGANLPLAVRCAVGMVISLIMLDDWLLPEGDERPTREELLAEVHGLVLGGIERSQLPASGRSLGQ